MNPSRRLLRRLHPSPLPNPRRHILAGLFGSMLILWGSWGVGWLAQSQLSWFAGSTVLNPLRVETGGVVFSAVTLILGCMLLVRSWLRLGQDLGLPGLLPKKRARNSPVAPEHPQAHRLIFTTIWVWAVPLLFTFPIFSRDVYSYLGQGRVLHSGLNPYEDGVSSLPGWFMQGADTIWAESPSPYGPLFLLFAQFTWFLTQGTPESAVILFRAVSVAGLVLCCWAVPRLARRFESNPNWALWVAVANPLFGLYLIAGVHNDSLMIGLLLVGFVCLRRRTQHVRTTEGRRSAALNLLGLILVACSVAIKPLTILALPFAGLMLVSGPDRTQPGYRQRAKAWVYTLAVTAVVMTTVGGISGLWFGWLPAMTTSGDAAFPYAPFGLIGLGVGWLTDTLFNTGIRTIADVVYTLGTLATLVTVAWLALRRTIIHPLRATGIVLVVAVLLAPIIQPWYLLWVLPLFAVVRVWRAWISTVLYLLVMALCVVGVVDQVSVAQWIPSLMVRLIALGIGLACMVFMVFVDRTTAVIFPFRRIPVTPIGPPIAQENR